MLLTRLQTKMIEEQVGVAYAQRARQSEHVNEANGKVAETHAEGQQSGVAKQTCGDSQQCRRVTQKGHSQ